MFYNLFLGSIGPMSSVDESGPNTINTTPQMGSKVVGGQSFTSDSKFLIRYLISLI